MVEGVVVNLELYWESVDACAVMTVYICGISFDEVGVAGSRTWE